MLPLLLNSKKIIVEELGVSLSEPINVETAKLNTESTLNIIPEELFQEILGWLRLTQLGKVAKISKFFLKQQRLHLETNKTRELVAKMKENIQSTVMTDLSTRMNLFAPHFPVTSCNSYYITTGCDRKREQIFPKGMKRHLARVIEDFDPIQETFTRLYYLCLNLEQEKTRALSLSKRILFKTQFFEKISSYRESDGLTQITVNTRKLLVDFSSLADNRVNHFSIRNYFKWLHVYCQHNSEKKFALYMNFIWAPQCSNMNIKVDAFFSSIKENQVIKNLPQNMSTVNCELDRNTISNGKCDLKQLTFSRNETNDFEISLSESSIKATDVSARVKRKKKH